MKKFSRSLNMVGVITLFFFAWSYLPLFQLVAYAATQDKQATKAQPQRSRRQQPAEKLEKLLDDLKADMSKAEEKSAKGADTSSEIESIKARKADTDAIDTDLKKEFALTEQKLKSANLPKEILSRHYKFVQNYESNLAELKTNLDAIEKAKTPSALTSEIVKTQKHVAKIKPPKKRAAFDPNRLPNQTRAAKKFTIEEKKPEEIKSKPVELRKKAHVNPGSKTPILVASNGPLDGLLPNFTQTVTPFSSISDLPLILDNLGVTGALSSAPSDEYQEANLLLDTVFTQAMTAYVLSHTPPTSAELVETPDVQFTQAIKDLAAQNNHQPSKLFFWVYNNIDTVPTYGAIQGADMCLQTKVCNPYDTASLLMALFRASGVHARYAYGTMQIEMDKIMRWLGVTDPRVAGTILTSNGISVKLLTSGGQIKYVEMEHVWVNAWIDYIPSRGAVHKQGDTWIPLDPSIKFYDTTSGIDIQAAVPFDAQAFANQIQSTATINEPEGYVTNINSALIQQTMQDYLAQVQNYLNQNHPNATAGDVLGKRTIKQLNWGGIMPCTTMFSPKSIAWERSALPDNMRSTISFNIPDPTGATNGLNYTTNLPQIAGKKITLSFSPASDVDLKTIQAYLPKPHTDGTSIQPSEMPSSYPAYLINLKPELRLDGQVVASGSPATMGSALSFTISLNEPGIGVSNIDNVIQSGEYCGIGLDTGRIGNVAALKSKIDSTIAKIDAQQYKGLNKDDLVGDFLSAIIAVYFAELDSLDEITAKTMNVIRYRNPSVGMFSLSLAVQTVFGIPKAASSKGMTMDVDRIMQAVFSKDGNINKVKQYMIMSGNNSSMLEHSVPEQILTVPENQYSVEAISAVKALKIANDQDVPLYTINQSNVNSAVTQLQVSQDVKNDIVNAINAGKNVTVSKTNITYNGWTGCGYIISDPVTGAGAYMISGGMNGAAVPESEVNDCERSYWERVMDNFILTNEVIPGAFAPTGLSLLLRASRTVAALNPEAGITFATWWRIGFGGAVLSGVTFTALETAVLVAATWLMTFILIAFAWEIGVIIGSMISAAIPTCQRRT